MREILHFEEHRHLRRHPDVDQARHAPGAEQAAARLALVVVNLGAADASGYVPISAELPEGERGTVELIAMPVETGSQILQVESRAGEGLSDETQQQIVVDGIAEFDKYDDLHYELSPDD